MELSSREADLNAHESTLEEEQRRMGELRMSLLTRELNVDLQANNLASSRKELEDREQELADHEKWLAEKQLEELAATSKRLDELQVVQVAKAQKILDFLGQTKTALVPLSFSLLCSGELVQDVSTALPLLDSTGAKMLKLEEVVCDQLEVEGHVLVEQVVEHVLMSFQSWDPTVSLDPVMLGPVAGTEEAASSGIQEVAKAVAARFQHLMEDA
jgi:hypothetical protein